MAQDVKFEVRNRMTIAELKAKNTPKDAEEIAKIEYFRKSNGRCFFICGDTRGYVSPAVGEKVRLNKVTAENLQYAECRMEGSEVWVPTIMMDGAELLGTM